MSRPGMSRRINRRGLIYSSGPVVSTAPFSNDLIHANYADREIVLAGSDVAAWGDVISNRDFAQADTSKDPLYGTFVAKPALVFDGVNDFMSTPTISLSPRSAITVAMTIQVDATLSGKMLYESSPDINANPGGFFIFQNVANQLQLAFKNMVGSVSKGIVITTGVHRLIFTMCMSPAPTLFSLVYLDGVSLAGTGVADRGFGDYAHYIGMRGGTTLPWPGKMGDILIYGRDLTAGEITSVDAWLATRAV